MENKTRNFQENPLKKGQSFYPVYIEDDEIDLYELFLTLKKRKGIILTITTLFTILAAAYALFSTPLYLSSSIVLLPETQNNNETQKLISTDTTDKLLKAIEEDLKYKRYEKVKKLTGINEEALNTIKEITVEKPRRGAKDNTFDLKVYGTDKKSLKTITKKLIDYLNNNPFIKKTIEDEKTVKENEIKELESKLPQLIKLATEIENKIKTSKNINILFNPLDLQTKIIEIKNRIDNLKFIVANKIHGYKIISSNVTDKPVKPKRTLIIVVGFVTGLFTGIFAAFFKEWLESVKNTRRREESE